MFKSKLRDIIIPQSEHTRLAGILASHWGNAQFSRPPIDFLSFVKGVTLHDRGYGVFDTLPLLEMSDDEWLQVTRKGFYQQYADAEAELIVKLHLRRLTSNNSAEPYHLLLDEMEQVIQQHTIHHQLERTLFNRIDCITRLCDNIAFDVCFEKAASGEVAVFAQFDSTETISIRYTFEPGGLLRLSSWPFAVSSVESFIIGYQRDLYPQQLEPVIVPFRCQKWPDS